MHEDIKSKKERKRKEYNLIRLSNSSLIHEEIKSNVKSAIQILLREYHDERKYIGIYWPLKGEVDIRFTRERCFTEAIFFAENQVIDESL